MDAKQIQTISYCIISAILLLSNFLFAETYVESTGHCNGETPCYNSLNNGIQNTSTGDLIYFSSEVFNENVNIDKNITINGGWDSTPSNDSTNAPVTVINGKISISGNGTAIVKDLIITPDIPDFSWLWYWKYEYCSASSCTQGKEGESLQCIGSESILENEMDVFEKSNPTKWKTEHCGPGQLNILSVTDTGLRLNCVPSDDNHNINCAFGIPFSRPVFKSGSAFFVCAKYYLPEESNLLVRVGVDFTKYNRDKVDFFLLQEIDPEKGKWNTLCLNSDSDIGKICSGTGECNIGAKVPENGYKLFAPWIQFLANPNETGNPAPGSAYISEIFAGGLLEDKCIFNLSSTSGGEIDELQTNAICGALHCPSGWFAATSEKVPLQLGIPKDIGPHLLTIKSNGVWPSTDNSLRPTLNGTVLNKLASNNNGGYNLEFSVDSGCNIQQ
ncbi:MAG: hypothetical protein GY853_09365 [PVC group bacterium]|nr:hypothetical protein [PVC group bacterium]